MRRAVPSALRLAAVATAGTGMAALATARCESHPSPAAEGSSAAEQSGLLGCGEAAEEMRGAMAERCATGVSIKDLRCGSGPPATEGSWVSVHYVVRLVGDGTILDDTRRSGLGDREYGQPFSFELGDLLDMTVLRALHPCVLDMRVGGVRRVRTAVGEPSFGYRSPPVLLEEYNHKMAPRQLQPDWLVDVEVSLESAAAQRPPRLVEQLYARARAVAGL